jgi:multiple sugar transport system ATP-binding protein
MRDDNIVRAGDPLTLFRHPENMFVAGFTGNPPMSLVKGKIQKRDGGLYFVENAEANPLTLPLRGNAEALGAKHVDKEVVFGIRPEQISNEPNGSGEPIHMTVEIAEPMGSESLVYLKTGSGSVIARIHGDHIFHLGEDVPAYFDMEKATFFDPRTENVIR